MFRTTARIFIAVWIVSGAAQAALAEKRVALVIGNSAYTFSDPLPHPKNDADDLAAALRRLHFEVTEEKDLTVSKFDRAVDAFEKAAKGADVALFFFSGHGVQIDKRGYLAPVDIKAESESSALRELEAIQEIISRIENAAKVSVIVLDACRNSPLQERLRRIAVEKNKAFIPPKGLPPVSAVGSNTLIVYATVPGETASDGIDRNSPFTASLLKNIETPGLEIELMFKRVTADVLNATGGNQQPERLSRLQNELVLVPAKPETKLQAPDEMAKLREQLARVEAELQKKQQVTAAIAGEGSVTRKASGLPENQAVMRTPAQVPEPPKANPQVALVAPPRPSPEPQKAIAGDGGCDGLLVSVAMPGEKPCIKPGFGVSFQDCRNCPEMVIVPSGSFTMGSPIFEQENASSEQPQHEVTIAKPFAVGKFAVTFAEWDDCVAAGGCGGYKPDDVGWGRSDHPVIKVSWNDAKAYVAWLSKKTGAAYRLLSEAEREYAARAGTTTPFWWGSTIAPDQANYDGTSIYAGGGSKGEWWKKPVPVQSFKPNPWGLHQVHGNVWEWGEDCWHASYDGAPKDGSAWTTEGCESRVLRGGSWYNYPRYLRSACRNNYLTSDRSSTAGFRVARTLNP